MFSPLLEKKVLSRILKGSTSQRSIGTFRGSRQNLFEMVRGGTLPEDHKRFLQRNFYSS